MFLCHANFGLDAIAVVSNIDIKFLEMVDEIFSDSSTLDELQTIPCGIVYKVV